MKRRQTAARIAAVAMVAVLAAGAIYAAYPLLRSRVAPEAIPTPTGAATTPAEREPVPPPASPTPMAERLPAHLSATLDPAIDPELHPPDAPLTVVFDRPVVADPSIRPLVFTPSIAGRFVTGTTAGGLIEAMGYVNFYLLTTVVALPGVLLFWLMIRSGLADLSIGSAGRNGGDPR